MGISWGNTIYGLCVCYQGNTYFKYAIARHKTYYMATTGKQATRFKRMRDAKAWVAAQFMMEQI